MNAEIWLLKDRYVIAAAEEEEEEEEEECYIMSYHNHIFYVCFFYLVW